MPREARHDFAIYDIDYGARARAGSYRTPPVCHGLLLDPPHWHDTLKCRAKRGTGGSPTVPRDTLGSPVGPSPGPGPVVRLAL